MSGIMDDFKLLANYAYRMIEGDDVTEEVMDILREYNFITEDDEWDYGEDDDD